jgi:cytochrome P450
LLHELIDDWNPLDKETLNNQRDAFDKMRESCPVAYSKFLEWSLFRHEDIATILSDPESFINVSKFPAIPNGLNPPEHGPWYRALATFFKTEPMARLEPRIRQIASQMIEPQIVSGNVEFVEAMITPFVYKCLCALLGWPAHQWKILSTWVNDNQSLAQHPNAQTGKELADSFAALVLTNLELQRASINNTDPSAIDGLVQMKVNDQDLSDESITTILRNWVAGHGTTADALGIVLKHVAEDSDLQQHLRQTPAHIPAAIEEILRMDGPLVANSRTSTREVEFQGRAIPKDAKLSLMWIAANRDSHAFKDAGDFKLERDTSASLVWGQGIHLCLGAPLARLEIRVALEELLALSSHFGLTDAKPARKVYPGNGYAALNLQLA